VKKKKKKKKKSNLFLLFEGQKVGKKDRPTFFRSVVVLAFVS